LSAEGKIGSPYQEFIIYKNYFTQNMAGWVEESKIEKLQEITDGI
jgi:NADPH-dependent curcumin reductase CurA